MKYATHVKNFASRHGMPYREAMKNQQCKDEYHELKEGGGLGKKIKKAFSKKNVMKGLDTGAKIYDKVNTGLQKTSKIYDKYVNPLLQDVPVVGDASNLLNSGLQETARLNNIQNKYVQKGNNQLQTIHKMSGGKLGYSNMLFDDLVKPEQATSNANSFVLLNPKSITPDFTGRPQQNLSKSQYGGSFRVSQSGGSCGRRKMCAGSFRASG